MRAAAQAAALAARSTPLDQRRLVWLLVFGDELVAVQVGGAAVVGFAVAEATEPLAHDLVIVDHQDADGLIGVSVIAGPAPRRVGRCRGRARS
jgi:hypothetical protein